MPSFNSLIILLLTVLANPCLAKVTADDPSRKINMNELVLNPEKLDLLLHNAALFALLKAKAHSLLDEPNFPPEERVIYSRCAPQANTAVQLANCIVPLLDAKERMKMRSIDSVSGDKMVGAEEMDWSHRLGRWLFEGLTKLQFLRKDGKLDKMKQPGKKQLLPKISSKEMFKRKRIKGKKQPSAKYKPNKLQIHHLPEWRRKRAAVEVNPVDFVQRMFQPNARQAKRAEMARAKRQGRDKALRQPMDLLNDKGVPWYLQPLGQLLRLAKALLQGKRISSRRMRQTESNTTRERRAAGSSVLNNIVKLKRIQHFYEMYEQCEQHLAEMGKANSDFLGQLSPSSNSPAAIFRMSRSQLEPLADELQQVLANYSFHSFPILSPRLFSIFPESKQDNNGDPNLLSPTMFSFHREGLFSLPTLFGMLSTSESDMLELLDLFMELSGASKVLDKLLAEIEPRKDAIQEQLYPTVLRIQQMEKRWESVHQTLSEEQRHALDRKGYTLLDKQQFAQLYGKKRAKDWTVVDEQLFEEDIRRIAGIQRKSNRAKRESTDELLSNFTSESDDIRTLRPFLFTNKLRQNAGVAVNGAILSPRAFATTLMSPNFMRLNVLSPVAFIPAILSPTAAALSVLSPTAFTANVLTPNTIWSEVLSPKFFHTNIISPRALASLILSPRTMLGEVLSPKFIEFRVLNPATFFAGVLTPNFLLPRVLSPANFGVTVLSPNILSPSILSKGNFTVQVCFNHTTRSQSFQVLSPSIMSDDVTVEQFWRGEWQKKTNATIMF